MDQVDDGKVDVWTCSSQLKPWLFLVLLSFQFDECAFAAFSIFLLRLVIWSMIVC